MMRILQIAQTDI